MNRGPKPVDLTFDELHALVDWFEDDFVVNLDFSGLLHSGEETPSADPSLPNSSCGRP